MVLTATLSACKQEGGGHAPGPPAQTGGKMVITLLPKNATALTDLQVTVAGAGTAEYQWRLNGQLLPDDVGNQLPKDRFSKNDTVTVTVTAGADERTSTVVIGNSPPKVDSVPLSPAPETIHAGVDITAEPVGSDPDGDRISYRCKWLVNEEEIPDDGPTLRSGRFKRGDKIQLSVTPNDGDEDGAAFVSQSLTIPNAAPRIVSNPPTEFDGDVYTYQVSAEDPDGDVLTYSLGSAPKGMTIDGKTGFVRWKIAKEQVGEFPIEVAAQDPGGAKYTQRYSLTISLPKEEKHETQ